MSRTVEGDYVCPDSLRADEAEREVERLRGLLRELDPFARYGLAAYCNEPQFSRLVAELEALRHLPLTLKGNLG